MNGRFFRLPNGSGWQVTAVVIGLLIPIGASAQSASQQAMVDRLDRLERDIRTLNAQLARGGTGAVPLSDGGSESVANGPAIARMGLRVDRLEQDLRAATGVMEEVNHRIRQVSERLDKLVGDVDFRLSALEARLAGPAPSGADQPFIQGVTPSANVSPPSTLPVNPPATLGSVSASDIQKIKDRAPPVADMPKVKPVQPAAPVVSGSGLPAGSAKEQYNYAFNLLQQTNFDQAEIALKSFIKENADDPLAANARYWLGETYYVRKQYQDAAQTFYDSYQKSPKGPKAADSLLKLGMSLAGLGKKDDACSAFAKVRSDFAKAPARILDSVAREDKRNGCS